MKVKIHKDFHFPSVRGFFKDEIREVSEEQAKIIIDRGLGVEVKKVKEKKVKRDKDN